VLHAMQSPDGKLSELELLASSDASINEAALARRLYLARVTSERRP